jgi:hypothetical protein
LLALYWRNRRKKNFFQNQEDFFEEKCNVEELVLAWSQFEKAENFFSGLKISRWRQFHCKSTNQSDANV